MSIEWKMQSVITSEINEQFITYPKLVRQMLFSRGIKDLKQAQSFLNPIYAEHFSPFIFKDMEPASKRILAAIKNREKIAVYGDYDADGVTASAILLLTFRALGVWAQSCIPDRFTEGYGVNLEALKKIKDQGVSLVITVDCGTNSIEAAKFCKENGIDLIITDHHEIIGEKPECFALINPKDSKDNYPNRDLTGAGVAFKLACAILNKARGLGFEINLAEGWEKWLLDLVAIGTVADCHSLLGENRILVKYGLKVFEKTKWAGLKALTKGANLNFEKKKPDAYVLGFVVAPRLNAAGRLDHANLALDLILEEDWNQALAKAQILENLNLKRQQLTQNVLSEAREKVALIRERKILALVGDGWPKGVVGLVAGRLAEEFYKPTIVMERTEMLCTGSARTAGEFDIVEALKYASEFLVKFGGHKQAAGLTLQYQHFENFYKKISEYSEIKSGNIENRKQLILETELGEADLNLDTLNYLAQFEPFGVGNLKPKFLVSGLKVVSSKKVGQSGKHTQFQFELGKKNIYGIAFNSDILEKKYKVGDTIDVASELIEDTWNGGNEVKLRVIDLKKIEN